MVKWNAPAIWLSALILVAFPAASRAADTNAGPASPRYYEAKGVVQKLDPNGQSVTIKHEAIPGYMGAMTMDFQVNNPNELRGLATGDAITFRLCVTDTKGWIDHVTKSGTVQIIDASTPSFVHIIPDVDLLQTNEVLPDTELTNEFGQMIHTDQFKGQALAFTFFFTRCPYPNFCPFLSSSFENAQKKLSAMTNGPTNWHLISISFDPENDTPAALKTYATAHDYDPAHWSFATGNLTNLIALGDRFGEYFGHDSSGGITHNLRTVVLDTHGRLQNVIIGNSWTSDELVADILKAAKN